MTMITDQLIKYALSVSIPWNGATRRGTKREKSRIIFLHIEHIEFAVNRCIPWNNHSDRAGSPYSTFSHANVGLGKPGFSRLAIDRECPTR
jgi:hypothetical protein